MLGRHRIYFGVDEDLTWAGADMARDPIRAVHVSRVPTCKDDGGLGAPIYKHKRKFRYIYLYIY